MIIIRSVLLLSFIYNPQVGARDLANALRKGFDTHNSVNINGHTKKSAKHVQSGVTEPKRSKKGTRSKGAKQTYRPSESPTDQPTGLPSEYEVFNAKDPPTMFPSPWPTYFPVGAVSDFPTEEQIGLDLELVVGIRTPECPPLSGHATPAPIAVNTPTPTVSPTSLKPSPKPSGIPTVKPTAQPTLRPSMKPTPRVGVTFKRGALTKDITRFGFKVNTGITVKKISQANKYVKFANGKRSKLKYHAMPDGAAVISLADGYVYISNAEIKDGRGGVYGLYFDRNGRVVDYKMLLSGTSRSCSGGVTPWNTYISCEEIQDGQCWQIDPDPSSINHSYPKATEIGRGYFEAIACDDRDPTTPVFYVVEDTQYGAVRKYTPPPQSNGADADWTSLHTPGGTTEFLLFIDDKSFTWTVCDEKAARLSQAANFPNPEGVDVKDGILRFVSKKTYKLYTLDLDSGTYTTMWTNNTLVGDGKFSNSPDQIVRNNRGEFLYFTEDGGSSPGVYTLDPSGSMYAIFEAYDAIYKGDETTGLAFSPNGNTMYANFQDCGCQVPYDKTCGCLFQFIRNDGMSFDDATQ